MAHGLVQQHAGPARAEHHGHLAGGRGARVQVGERRMHRFIDIGFHQRVVEIGQAKAATAPAAAGFAPAVLLGNHGHRQADQRPHIRSQRAVGTRHQHHIVFGGEPCHHLHHARVLGAGEFFDLLQQLDLGGAVERGHRVQRGVKRAAGRDLAGRHLAAFVLRRAGDGAHGGRGIHQRGFGDVVGIGKGGFFARHRAHAHALVDAEAPGLDDAFLQAPALRAGVLEVQVGVVDLVRLDGRQSAAEVGFIQTEGVEQQGLGRGQAFEGGFAGNHADDCRQPCRPLSCGEFPTSGHRTGSQVCTSCLARAMDIRMPSASPSVTMAVPP